MPKSQVFKTNQPGKEVLVWAVMFPGAGMPTMTLPFGVWNTREEAIEAYCKSSGKTWEQLEAEGATVIQRKVTMFENARPL